MARCDERHGDSDEKRPDENAEGVEKVMWGANNGGSANLGLNGVGSGGGGGSGVGPKDSGWPKKHDLKDNSNGLDPSGQASSKGGPAQLGRLAFDKDNPWDCPAIRGASEE